MNGTNGKLKYSYLQLKFKVGILQITPEQPQDFGKVYFTIELRCAHHHHQISFTHIHLSLVKKSLLKTCQGEYGQQNTPCLSLNSELNFIS
jgi:hypothetical protein